MQPQPTTHSRINTQLHQTPKPNDGGGGACAARRIRIRRHPSLRRRGPRRVRYCLRLPCAFLGLFAKRIETLRFLVILGPPKNHQTINLFRNLANNSKIKPWTAKVSIFRPMLITLGMAFSITIHDRPTCILCNKYPAKVLFVFSTLGPGGSDHKSINNSCLFS